MSESPRTLATRPEATTFQVDDLLDHVRRGRVRLPRFQRGLRWENRDRYDLFDSIRRGFPIGTLLLWKRYAPADAVRIGRFYADADERSDALWVVDGQQRITTLVDALVAPAAPEDFPLVYDLNTQRFGPTPRQPSGAPEERLLPVGVVFDSKRLNRWAREHGLPEDDFDEALELGKRLREYRVPAYIIETDDHEVVRGIFDRTNRSGKRLNSIEVFDALFGAFDRGDADPLATLENSEAARRFGGVSRGLLLQCFQAVAGLPLDKDFAQPLEPKRAEIPVLVARTREAFGRAATFLQRDARVPAGELLPYTLPLPVLTKFFDRFPEPNLRNRRLLRRWLWRGIVAMSLAGSSVGLRKHVDAVSDKEAASVQALLALSPKHIRPEMFDVTEMRAGTAKFAACLCALAAQNPRDLETGLPSLFADTGARKLNLTLISGEHARGLAGRFFLPSNTAKTILQSIATSTNELALASHGVSTEMAALLRRGDVRGFFVARTARLDALVQTFFSGLAEAGADDSPALADLDIEVEGDDLDVDGELVLT